MKTIRALIAALCLTPAIALGHPAEDLVMQLTNDLITALDSPEAKSDSNFVRQVVYKDVLPHIDFELMTKLTVSKHWKKASSEQRDTLESEFRELLLNTYTKALDEYSGQTMEFLPYQDSKKDKRAEVRTLFKDSAATADIPVDYKLRQKADGRWLIYDIEVENISLVRGYKSEFTSQIKKGGFDGLIKALKSKNGK
ncbi:hypothetical protein AB833_11375 [Chromatiales bacterium (ex Bugula neritina AB1)]|nr:hypothetical protein AB833_11375 [Chromatiales bacterium (ex Bugula neritina AB1)]